jgi:hypothetical protein
MRIRGPPYDYCLLSKVNILNGHDKPTKCWECHPSEYYYGLRWLILKVCNFA